MKKTTSLLLTLIMLLSVCAITFADTGSVSKSIDYLYQTTPTPTVSSIGGEWAVLGLARSDSDIPEQYFEQYYNRVKDYVREQQGILHEQKYTEYSRVILALTAIGKNPENVAGYNLLLPLGDYEKTIGQGLNGAIWALIALDSGHYAVAQNPTAAVQATRELYVEKILSAQKPDGGWAFTDTGASDIDLTAMALCALSKYEDNANVQAAIDTALGFLSEVQNEDGGFTSWGSTSSESSAQVLLAFGELGISVHDVRFVKNGKTVQDHLMTFAMENGGFRHTLDEADGNQMSLEQAVCALVSQQRVSAQKTSFYDMSDVTPKSDESDNIIGLPDKNPDVVKQPIGEPISFSDIADHPAKAQIEALAARGIINGKGEGIFDPDATMTRAEFATIVTRSLGLAPTTQKIFEDVAEDQWFFGFVSTAFQYGIVSGISDTEFNPGGIINKEESAAMVRRAAKLCGMNDSYDDSAVRDILAGFSDYIQASDWAKESLAFCYDKKILSDSELEIHPKQPVTRAEIAEMLYQMLDAARLL